MLFNTMIFKQCKKQKSYNIWKANDYYYFTFVHHSSLFIRYDMYILMNIQIRRFHTFPKCKVVLRARDDSDLQHIFRFQQFKICPKINKRISFEAFVWLSSFSPNICGSDDIRAQFVIIIILISFSFSTNVETTKSG